VIRREDPGWDAARAALYDGAVLLTEPTEASRRAAAEAEALLASELGVDDVRRAHEALSPETLFARIGRVRRTLFLDPRWHEIVREVIAACGVDPARAAFDPIRLRVVSHRGHENPRAKAVYLAHRDTWYAHSQAVITWWIPLHDLPEEETFVFYPERFAAAVPNESEIFEYGDWVREGWDLKIGWQHRDHGLKARYPGVIGDPDPGPAVGFSCRRGDNLRFSGAQFHATRPQSRGTTRYSLDFRVVWLDDHAAGRGAPNVDNRSRGSALVDYVRTP